MDVLKKIFAFFKMKVFYDYLQLGRLEYSQFNIHAYLGGEPKKKTQMFNVCIRP